MSDLITAEKDAHRQRVRHQLLALTPEAKSAAAHSLIKRLTELPPWTTAKSVLLFAPRPDEPNLWPLVELGLRADKQIALPRFVAASESYEAALISDPAKDVAAGKFNILEPSPLCRIADLKRLDLVLVPGLAFDWHGHRLGRGKGYYDRLLATVSGKTCGVAFDIQLLSALPVEPHDVRLNCILTPSHWLEF